MSDTVLINKTKNKNLETPLRGETDVRDADLQEANAATLADLRIRQNSMNVPLYFVRTEDPALKSKVRTFVALKLREDNAFYLEVIGIETKMNAHEHAFNSYDDLLTFVQQKDAAVTSIRFPWDRVISIENTTYQSKKVQK